MQNINIVQYKISNTFFIVFLLSMAFFSLKAQIFQAPLSCKMERVEAIFLLQYVGINIAHLA